MSGRWVAGGFAVALLAGCGGTPDEDDGEGATRTATETSSGAPSSRGTGATASSSADPSPGSAEGVADAVAALQTAAAAVPNGRPFDMERDIDQGRPVWDIEVGSDGNQVNLYVSADGSEVLRQARYQTPDDDVQKLAQASIGAVEALQIAAGRQEGVLEEMEIDTTRDGTVVWEVELRAGGRLRGEPADRRAHRGRPHDQWRLTEADGAPDQRTRRPR